jgi:hypothetical protein
MDYRVGAGRGGKRRDGEGKEGEEMKRGTRKEEECVSRVPWTGKVIGGSVDRSLRWTTGCAQRKGGAVKNKREGRGITHSGGEEKGDQGKLSHVPWTGGVIGGSVDRSLRWTTGCAQQKGGRKGGTETEVKGKRRDDPRTFRGLVESSAGRWIGAFDGRPCERGGV